ncbi:MAG: sugar phosphate nucleotidyltransferase [bacterium]|nr:sugar phosphate nucleotidyltransferase [bacterium]
MKAIIPIAGLATRFLPLSKAVPKELLPLADKPMIQYSLEEAINSGVDEIIFIVRPDRKKILDYLKPSPKIEKFLKERQKDEILEKVKKLDRLFEGISFTYVSQKDPLGDGHAILQAKKMIKDEPVCCMFADDVFDSKIPVLSQLLGIFKTCQKTVIGLSAQPEEKISKYGIVGVEKIANKLYKITKIVEKPSVQDAPSNLAIVGRYILTPEIFSFLKKAKPSKRGEIILAEVMNNFMIREGRLIYGHEFSGNWLECGDMEKWIKSNIYFSLKEMKIRQ